jgi:hypothetical protein
VSQRVRWAIIMVLLVPAVVLPPLVGIYDRVGPSSTRSEPPAERSGPPVTDE